MQLRALLNPATLGVVWILGAVTLDAQAGTENTDETEEPVVVEFSGRLSAEGRWFPEAGAFAGQRSLAGGFSPNRDSIWKTPAAEASLSPLSSAAVRRNR